MTRLVGLSGYARAGKDTAAAHLLTQGWTRLAFADPMREFAEALNPLVMVDGTPWTLASLLGPERDWERAKSHPDVRALLQRLGTECGRKVLGEDVWVRATMDKVTDHDHVVITDVRFPNEAEAVRAAGGLMVRIVRPGVEAVNRHASETALDGFDFDVVVVNDGDAALLGRRLLALVEAS